MDQKYEDCSQYFSPIDDSEGEYSDSESEYNGDGNNSEEDWNVYNYSSDEALDDEVMYHSDCSEGNSDSDFDGTDGCWESYCGSDCECENYYFYQSGKGQNKGAIQGGGNPAGGNQGGGNQSGGNQGAGKQGATWNQVSKTAGGLTSFVAHISISFSFNNPGANQVAAPVKAKKWFL